MFSNHPPMPYNDLNTSFTSEGTDISYDSDSTFHIYNELNYPTQQPQYQLQQQQLLQQQQHQQQQLQLQHQQQQLQLQQLQQQQAANNSQAINIQSNGANANPTTGIIYGFRTRHLSCIEENDSDSLHSSSVPKPAFDVIQDVDEKFKKLVAEEPNSSLTSWADNGEDEVDHIAMIDESRVYELDYLDELSASQVVHKSQEDEEDEEEDEQYGVNVSEALWQSTVSEPVHRSGFIGARPPGIMPDIMTTSCYGALNTSFGSEMSGPPAYNDQQSTPTKQPPAQGKQEPIYATPDKRRECNRSFDSSCPSQSSSLYGGSMTSSLDLRCMSASGGYGANNFNMLRANGVNPMEISGISLDGSKSEWNSSSGGAGIISPTEDINDEMAVKCLSAAENDLQSIRRLLEHDTSASVCPSCRISFDKGKRRKLIDTCGHERCYSCMFRNDQCPMCMNSSLKDVDCSSNAQGYDTGIGGSTSTIVSPLGSPQPQLRSQVQRTNAAALARYMQATKRIPQWEEDTTPVVLSTQPANANTTLAAEMKLTETALVPKKSGQTSINPPAWLLLYIFVFQLPRLVHRLMYIHM